MPDHMPRKASSKWLSPLAAKAAALAAVLAAAIIAAPAAQAQETGHKFGTSANVSEEPLQELLKKRRPRGAIYLAVPQALVIVGEGPNKRPACAPQILVTNSSNQTLEELVVGIRYRKAGGKTAGSTLTRFYVLKTGKQDLNYLSNALEVSNCDDLSGEVEIIQCTYDTGESCIRDVRALAYGAVPLTTIEKK